MSEPAGEERQAGQAPTRRQHLHALLIGYSARAQDESKRHASVAVPFRAIARNRRVAASALSGGFAYRLFFWLLPFGLIVGGAFGLMNADSPADAVAAGGVPYAVADAVGDACREANIPPWSCLVIGVPGLVWAGYTGSKAAVLIHALIWDETPGRATNRLKTSLAFTCLLLGFMFVTAAVSWFRDVSSLVTLLTAVLTIGPVIALWLWVSLQLPHGQATWKELLPGAVLFALGLEAMYVAAALVLVPNTERSSALYGAFGAASTLLFWLYLAGRLVVTAPILNSSVHHERRARHATAGQVLASGSTSPAADPGGSPG